MTILNTVEIVEKTWGWDWLGFVIGILAIVLMIVFFFFDADGDTSMAGLSLVFCVVLFAASGFIFANAKEKDKYNKYLVVFEDNTSINEVYENYNVIDREGIAFWITDVEGE